MDYDIKIIHNDGTYSYYSKVCEEKSGGETQTPFYVTVAASFVQLYSNNIGGEAAGLVLFDEPLITWMMKESAAFWNS